MTGLKVTALCFVVVSLGAFSLPTPTPTSPIFTGLLMERCNARYWRQENLRNPTSI